jgi:hypothetical protein
VVNGPPSPADPETDIPVVIARRVISHFRGNAVAYVALVVALGTGSAYAAGQINGSDIKRNSIPGNRVRNNALTGKQINESTLAQVPSAKVAATAGYAKHAGHATSADTATSATNAGHATSADTASSAQHASTADRAADSDQLGGLAASAYQQRVTGTCSSAVTSINQDGSVNCASPVVVPIDAILANPGASRMFVGDLELDFNCNVQGTGTNVLFLNDNTTSQATLNWFYWNLSASTAGGQAMPAGGGGSVFGFSGGRIDGQFIYSIHNQEQITVNLHAIDQSSSCEISGTAEYAPH